MAVRFERATASMGSLLLAATLGAAGCDQATTEAAPDAGPSAAPAPSATVPTLPLQASWKGEPIALRSALCFSRGGSAIHFTFSTHELTCAHLREAVTEHPGEVHFDVTAAPMLDADGKEHWAISSARFGEVTRRGDLGAIAPSTFDPALEVRATFDHKWMFPPSELQLKGPVAATGCGVLPWSNAAKVRPQKELRARLADKPLVINGATVEQSAAGVSTLRLTTEPHVCGTVLGSDIAMTLTIPAKGSAISAVRVEGYSLKRTLFKQLEANAITAKVQGEAELTIELAGNVDVGGYDLSLEGTVVAERCAPPAR